MKRADDPRHIKRIKIMEGLFAEIFQPQKNPFFFDRENLLINNKDIIDVRKTLKAIKINTHKIDPLIEKAAPQFPIEKIAKIDVAILRLAIFELMYEKKEPAKVIVDEAIELAKEFGGENSPSFINGVLGYLLKNQNARLN